MCFVGSLPPNNLPKYLPKLKLGVGGGEKTLPLRRNLLLFVAQELTVICVEIEQEIGDLEKIGL